MRLLIQSLIGLVLLCMPPAAGGGTAEGEACEAEVIAAWDRTACFEGVTTLRQHAADSGSSGFTVTGSATYLKRDGQLLSRQLLQYVSPTDGTTVGVTNVFDGNAVWVKRPGVNGVEVYKMPHEPQSGDFLSQGDWRGYLEVLRRTSTLTWLGSLEINGTPVCVLDVTLESPVADSLRSVRSYFSLAHGIPIRAEGRDESGHLVYEWSFEIRQVNQRVDPRVLQFEIPANATVHDLTKGNE